MNDGLRRLTDSARACGWRVLVSLGFLVALASASAAPRAQQSTGGTHPAPGLDEASLAEAVRLGETSEPAPWLLYHDPRSDEATMAVYTPFVRVAMAAHAAKRRGGRLDMTTLPGWVVERGIHVVIRPFSRSAGAASQLFPDDPPLARTPPTHIGLQQRDSKVPSRSIPPRWTTTDLSYLAALGGRPFPDAVAAAAFDPDVMVAGLDVYAWWRKENHFFPSLGLLHPEEMKHWR